MKKRKVIDWLVSCRRGPQIAHAFVNQADLSVCGQKSDDYSMLTPATEHDRHCKHCDLALTSVVP